MARIRSSRQLTEDGLVLAVFPLGVGTQDGAKAVVVHLLLISHAELAPPLLASLALHLILVDGCGGVELGEVALEVLVDLIIDLGQAQG